MPKVVALPSLALAKRVVIKIGSSLVADLANAQVRRAWMQSIATDIAQLHARGNDVILVSSGAVALGRPCIGLGVEALDLSEKQAAAAAGQPLLMQAWAEAFAPHAIGVAQVLLTLEDSEDRRRYLNARTTFTTLLSHRLIPIVNENDTVATAELKFGDNDRLAARVAVMTSADTLVLFSDIDGLYTADPRKDKGAQHIARVDALDASILSMGGGAASATSNGGMKTKLDAAQMALSAGCHMVIAKGEVMHPIQAMLDGARCTWFVASTRPQLARKHWIATSVHARGGVVIDEGAERALTQGKSLLPAGVVKVQGTFERGDTIAVTNLTGTLLARGISAYAADEAQKIMGKKTSAIAGILGYAGRDTLIHRDDLALI
ncbi:MAG: glutamate 5-kinase [Azospirillum brasilense]|nr:MAG: glutamate 5-kinase [Azospirillum brasilense]